MTSIEIAGASIDTRHYINGQRVSSAETYTNTSPIDGSFLGEIARGGEHEVNLAVAAAKAAFKGWAAMGPRKRGEILLRLAELVEANIETLAQLETMDNGSLLRSHRRGVMPRVAMNIRFFAEWAINDLHHEVFETRGHTNNISWDPSGVCALITPWNAPLMLATWKIGPALAAGCTIVVKPAELTPLTTLMLVKTFEEAGLPAGVINVITTSTSSATSGPLIADHRLRKITFTGSTVVGRKLIQQASERVLRTSMELGGNAPFLVFEDADVDSAVSGAMLAKMRNIGQACTAANRFIVHESVADEFASKFAAKMGGLKLGRGIAEGTTCGPVINQAAQENMERLVAATVSEGGDVLVGGESLEGDGYFFKPTVLDNVSADSTIWKEEIFGPIAPIVRFKDEADAVRLANDTEYGLVSYAYTNDEIGRAHV